MGRIKKVVLLCFICSSNLLFSQQTVILTPKSCEEGVHRVRNWDFKLTHPNGENEKIKLDFAEKFIKVLNEGSYEMEYKTIYNKKESIKFAVKGKDTVNHFYCIDKLSIPEGADSTTIIDQLTAEDEYQLIYRSGGCFHNERDTITIVNLGNNKLEATTGGNRFILDEDLFLLFKKVEKVINFGRTSGGCTTQDSYTIALNGIDKMSYLDTSCNWNAFWNIKYKLRQLKPSIVKEE